MITGAPARWGANVGVADACLFEAGIGGWNAGDQASATVQSTDQAHQGTNSLKITRNGVAGTYLATTSTGFPVAASTTYVMQFWFWTAQASAVVKIDFDYYQTNGTTYVDSLVGASANTSLVQNTWSFVGTSVFTTPALTGFIRPIPVSISGLANTNTLYMDDIFLARPFNPIGPPATMQAMIRASTF